MMRRRYYGREVLEAIPLVAPVHEDGTYLTPDEIAAQLGSVNIIDKYNQSGIPNKKYAYTISNAATEIVFPNYPFDFLYYETINGEEKSTKYSRDDVVTPTNGSEFRYVIVCNGSIDVCYFGTGEVEWIFSGKCYNINSGRNRKVKHIHISSYFNSIPYLDECLTVAGKLNIPSYLEDAGSYSFCFKITEVEIPNNIKTIRANAFTRLTGLTKLSIPNSIEGSLQSSFGVLSSLKELYIDCGQITDIGLNSFCESIPANVTLGENAINSGKWIIEDNILYFKNGEQFDCLTSIEGISGVPNVIEGTKRIANQSFVRANITSIILHEPLESIGDKSFVGSTIETIEFPNTLKTIGTLCFAQSYKGKLNNRITIPNGVTIGSQAFYENRLIKDIVFIDGDLETILGTRCFEPCCQAPSVPITLIIPDCIKIIPNKAFNYVRASYVVIGKNVTTIGNLSFGNYTHKAVYVRAEIPPIIYKTSFRYRDPYGNIVTLYVPKEKLSEYTNATYWGTDPDYEPTNVESEKYAYDIIIGVTEVNSIGEITPTDNEYYYVLDEQRMIKYENAEFVEIFAPTNLE